MAGERVSLRELDTPRESAPGRLGEGDELAYALLEEARLRCQELAVEAAVETARVSLRRVHRELGMAGWLTSSELDQDRRLALLAGAHQRSRRRMMDLDQTYALAGVMVCGEDVLAETLTDDGHSGHLHLAHVHLLQAMGLLADHLS